MTIQVDRVCRGVGPGGADDEEDDEVVFVFFYISAPVIW